MLTQVERTRRGRIERAARPIGSPATRAAATEPGVAPTGVQTGAMALLLQHSTTDGSDGRSYSANLYDDGTVTIDLNEPTTGASVAIVVDRGRWSDSGIVGCTVLDAATLAALHTGLRSKIAADAARLDRPV